MTDKKEHFACPTCGRSTRNGDDICDAGNGFCVECASKEE